MTDTILLVLIVAIIIQSFSVIWTLHLYGEIIKRNTESVLSMSREFTNLSLSLAMLITPTPGENGD